MLDKLCRDPSHLERLLKLKLAEEKKLKLLDWLKLDNFHDVEEWKENIYCLLQINKDCEFQCETFALAVYILDDFLGFVKVHGKYLKCAAVTSYYIAAKLLEEDEFVPDLTTFIDMTKTKFTPNDITRMEKIILEKTNWNINHITICSFLDIFFSIICGQHFQTLFGSDSLAYSIYRNLASQSMQCLSYVSLLQYQGSIKALALLSCTLEKITSRWFIYIQEIANNAKMNLQEFLECRDVIKSVVFGQQKKLRAPTRVRKFTKRLTLLNTKRTPLSPIDENPQLETVVRQSKTEICVNIVDREKDINESLFQEELSRLCQISLEPMQFSSPAKKRKLNTSCSLESKLNNNLCGLLNSPIKPLSV